VAIAAAKAVAKSKDSNKKTIKETLGTEFWHEEKVTSFH